MKQFPLWLCVVVFAATLAAPALAQPAPITPTVAAGTSAPAAKAALPTTPQTMSTPASPLPNASPIGTTSAPPTLTLTPPIAPLATQLGKTIQTLVGVPSSQPAPGETVSSGTTTSPADEDTENYGVNFASDLLDALTQAVNTLKADTANFVGNISSLPTLVDWAQRQNSDPRRHALWSAIGSDLLVIVGVPLLGAIALTLLLLPVRQRLWRERPEHLRGRITVLLTLLALRLFPVAVFFGCSLVLLDQNEAHNLPRYVVLNVIYAITLATTIRQSLRALFAPASDHLRLIKFTTPQAIYAFRWFSIFSLIIVSGYYLVDISTALHVPSGAVILFQNLLALILTVMAVLVIFQTRLRVAVILRGRKILPPERFDYAFRLWLARHWHSLTTAYLIVGLTVTTLEVDHGIAVMLRGTVITFIAFVLSRISFLALDAWTAPRAGASLTHRQVLAFLIRPFIWAIAALTIAASWGFRINMLVASPTGQRVTTAVLSIGLTLFILTVLYEALNSAIERYLSRSSDPEGKTPVASARARTLLPMVRNSVFILFSGVAMLTFLSAVGINIGPLLAGAGVVGVAIGFGSQSLVKDFLTGLFIVVENTVAVGDIVKIGEFSGVVEAMSVRTIRLRDIDGSLHILPFSEVSKITNMTKGFSYAVVTVGIAYGTDPDRVMGILREIGASLQEDPIFKRVILEPIEVFGIDSLGDSSIMIQSRMRTRPGKQWDIKRQLLLRIVHRFDKEGIDIPFPTVTHLTKTIDTGTPTPPLPL